MARIKFIFVMLALSVSVYSGSASAQVPGVGSAAAAVNYCPKLKGSLFGVLKNTDWNNAFPITVFGISAGPNSNPPRLHMRPLCKCNWRFPGLNEIPFGIGITYWLPLYIAEVTHKAGCFIALPETHILKGYEAQSSGRNPLPSGGNSTNQNRQVHFYIYALFKLLDLFSEILCSAGNKGFDLAYVTEIDPSWQNDLWASTFFPEGALFANPVARVACAVEAVKINLLRSFPIDAMWWCLGSNHMYPVSSNSGVTDSAEMTNMKALGRFLYKQHRTFFLSETIGKSAECSSNYTPRLPKQQYRVNPVFPKAERVSKPIVLGRDYKFWKFPPSLANFPSHEGGAYVLWRGTQCCLRF